MAENLFLSSCSDGHLEKVKAALQEGVDINTKDQSTNRTGLMKALIFHQNPVARVLLVDSNQEVDINCADTFGCTALHCAMIHGNREGVEMLLARQDLASFNQKCKNGETPLMLAIAYDKVDCVESMLAEPLVSLDIKGVTRTPEQVAR